MILKATNFEACIKKYRGISNCSSNSKVCTLLIYGHLPCGLVGYNQVEIVFVLISKSHLCTTNYMHNEAFPNVGIKKSVILLKF